MSCPIPPKLVTYYSNKVNIYDNKCFIPLPNYKTCPPPPVFAYVEAPCMLKYAPNGLELQTNTCIACCTNK